MTAVSPVFLGIGLLAVAAVHLLRGRVPRDLILLVASLAFVVIALDPISMAGLGMFVLAGYAALQAVGRWPRGVVLAAAVTAVVVLFWLLGENDVPLGLPRPQPMVLLGLSYVMFRLLHLLIDTGQGQLDEPIPFRAYLGYLLFFPNFLAGPIQRYEDLAPQLAAPAPGLTGADLQAGLARLVGGAFAAVVPAGLAFEVFMEAVAVLWSGDAPAVRGLAMGAALLAFAVWLYASFAGYMGVAIGLGRLAGLAIPENFDRPWLSRNFLELWSRWHITLSEWFKFYLFNPITKELLRVVDRPAAAPWLGAVGFFLTFFVMGIWHGTTAGFAVYGLLLGLGVSVNKAWQVWMTGRLGRRGYAALASRGWYAAAARTAGLSWFVVSLTLVWSDLENAVASVSGLGATGCLIGLGVVVVAIGIVVGLSSVLAGPADRAGRLLRSEAAVWAMAVAQAGAIAYYLLVWQGMVPSLIYQRF